MESARSAYLESGVWDTAVDSWLNENLKVGVPGATAGKCTVRISLRMPSPYIFRHWLLMHSSRLGRRWHDAPLRDPYRRCTKEASHRGSAHPQASGNRRFTETCGGELSRFLGMMGHGRRPPMPLAAFPGLRNPRFHPLPQNVALKLGKDRQHPGQRPARRRGEIQRFLQRDKALWSAKTSSRLWTPSFPPARIGGDAHLFCRRMPWR